MQHMVSHHRSKTLRRRLPSLLHPVFRRAPVEGTVGIEFFPNDDFFPDIGSLFIDDMGDNSNANASAAAAPYDYLIFLFTILLQFLLVVVALDLFYLSTIQADRMISIILVILVINYLLFSRIKSIAKFLYIHHTELHRKFMY